MIRLVFGGLAVDRSEKGLRELKLAHVCLCGFRLLLQAYEGLAQSEGRQSGDL